MKTYDVAYKMRDPRYPKQFSFLYKWAREKLDARGIVHASKLAQSHLKDLRKICPKELQIEFIREIDSDA